MRRILVCALVICSLCYATSRAALRVICSNALEEATLDEITLPNAEVKAIGNALNQAVDKNDIKCLKALAYNFAPCVHNFKETVVSAIQRAFTNDMTGALEQLLFKFHNYRNFNLLPTAAQMYNVAVQNNLKEHFRVVGKFLHSCKALTLRLQMRVLNIALYEGYFDMATEIFDTLTEHNVYEGVALILQSAEFCDVSPMLHLVVQTVKSAPDDKSLGSLIVFALLKLHESAMYDFVGKVVTLLDRDYVYRSFITENCLQRASRDCFFRDLEAGGFISSE